MITCPVAYSGNEQNLKFLSCISINFVAPAAVLDFLITPRTFDSYEHAYVDTVYI